MPTYDYSCDKCNRTFEVFQSITAPKFTKHSDVTEGHDGLTEPCDGIITRLLGTGGTVIFKGEGFYCNDYLKNKGEQ
jgi:putative FmdB family regulatory protein